MWSFRGHRRLEFDWDAANVGHIGLHRVDPDEVEEVFAQSPLVWRRDEKRFAALCPTEDGRLLIVVFMRTASRLIRVVTARDVSEREKRLYRRRQRG